MSAKLANSQNPFVLVIMDGYGLNPNPRGNAVYHAKTPTLDHLFTNYPNSTLVSFGPAVGLPVGQMGNSEVGHLNIGGGRIIQQELSRINNAIEDNELINVPELASAFDRLKSGDNASALHLIGLVSTGGVHSSLEHLIALIKTAILAGIPKIYIHVITDGRDRPPTSSIQEVAQLEEAIDTLNLQNKTKCAVELKIVSIIGRFYAMDRDNRSERTEKAFQLFTQGKGERFTFALDAIAHQHSNGITDEFLEPMFIDISNLSRSPKVGKNDVLLFFNFRTDRMRQIVSSFLAKDNSLSIPPENILTMTEYEKSFPVNVLFKPLTVRNHLGEVISKSNRTQLRIAETEKYPHVTYFFNCGNETPYPGEDRILIPSPRDVKTYDLKAEMSAFEVNGKLIERLKSNPPDITIVNFANCDMVGHTGNFPAAVKAVETVDSCLKDLLTTLESVGGTALITADHGNAEQMIDYETGEPHTAHTTYPVPIILYSKQHHNLKIREGSLRDIAPTICSLVGLDIPTEMTGQNLVYNYRKQ